MSDPTRLITSTLVPPMLWRCPVCRGSLRPIEGDATSCVGCGAAYASVAGILDLRTPGPCWIDIEADRAAARTLAQSSATWSLEEMVRHVISNQPGRNPAEVALRSRQVMESVGRLRSEWQGWLRPLLDGTPFLDLGCGHGALVAAAGAPGVGIDVCMVWLVVAQRMIQESGGTPLLAAARAEALPLADASVYAVVSLDVIEHVGDPAPYLREIDRVTRAGGRVALSTPNRYSLTAEPHVWVWGVGWLPRRYQARYVRWRSNKTYDYCRLLSARELARLLGRHTRFRCEVLIPPVSESEIAMYSATRSRLARLYNRLSKVRGSGLVFRLIGPFFRVTGTKTAGP